VDICNKTKAGSIMAFPLNIEPESPPNAFENQTLPRQQL